MRIIVTLLLLLQLVWGYQYNTFLLRTQIKLYPKIIFFDRNLLSKVKNKEIIFGIIYEKVDSFVAQKIIQWFKEMYGERIGEFRVILKPFDMETYRKNIPLVIAIYVLKLYPADMKYVAHSITKKGIYSFTYDKNDLKYGFLCSVAIEKDIVIYLNKKVLEKENFDFVDSFFSIVRFVE